MKPHNRLVRFLGKIRKANGCWEWEGSLDSKGYGVVRMDGKQCVASRVSWEIHVGPIPEGMFICHHCDNPKCVRPDHLFVGSPADNAADAALKGRMRYGEKHGRHKLSEEDVRMIRSSRSTTRQLSRDLGVARSLIYAIRNRLIWRRVV
jgi:hypothetical protein